MKTFRTSFTVTALLLLLTTGCSTAFKRDWKTATAQPAPTDSIAGPWEGTWLSHKNGHNGRLRCILTPETPDRYRAQFHAQYKRILSFGYTVPLTVRSGHGTNSFHGEANLGRLAGGVYTYDGYASPTNFSSTYKSKHDHGVFQMRRPQPSAGPHDPGFHSNRPVENRRSESFQNRFDARPLSRPTTRLDINYERSSTGSARL